MNFLLYARKSTEDKDRQVQSIPDQIKVLTELAQARGYTIVDIVTDQKSAKAPGRPGFMSMMSRIEKGEAQGILCWKIDRLVRNTLDSGVIQHWLQTGKIQEIVTMDKTHYPDDNTLLLLIECGMATQYIRDLSKSVKRGMESKVEKGWMPTKAPIGYRNEISGIKGAKRILPDETLFPVLQYLWQRILKERSTLMRLYQYMKAECPIYRNDRLISFSSFHQIFGNRFYCGLFKWNDQWHVGKHKAMLTQQEFEEVQMILRGTNKLRHSALQFDFKGLFTCGCCGAVITAEQHQKVIKKTQEIKAFRYYRCGHRKVAVTCKEKPLSEKKIEEFILNEIENHSIPCQIIEFGLRKLRTEPAFLKVDVHESQLLAETQDIKKRLQRMRRNMAEEPDAEIRSDIKHEMNALEIHKQDLEQQLERERIRQQSPKQEITNALELALRASEQFIGGSAQQRRDIIRGLGSNWEIKEQKLHYKPHHVSVALRTVREKHEGDLMRFEPKADGNGITKNLPEELVSLIWSG